MTVGRNTRQKGAHNLRCLFLDLDDTLYRHHEVANLVRLRIQDYMHEKLGIPAEEVEQTTQELYAGYGTTMAGLVTRGYKIDFDDWHKCVHHQALDYDHMIRPDIVLREILCSINLPKYVLTNADHKHAELCLARLGIQDCFQGIFDFEWVMQQGHTHGLITPEHPVLCKPNPQVYKLCLEAVKCEPGEVLFFDDSLRNIASAHAVGLMTAIVGVDRLVPGADLALPTLHQLPAALPELMDQPGMVHDAGKASEGMEHALEPVAVAVGN